MSTSRKAVFVVAAALAVGACVLAQTPGCSKGQSLQQEEIYLPAGSIGAQEGVTSAVVLDAEGQPVAAIAKPPVGVTALGLAGCYRTGAVPVEVRLELRTEGGGTRSLALAWCRLAEDERAEVLVPLSNDQVHTLCGNTAVTDCRGSLQVSAHYDVSADPACGPLEMAGLRPEEKARVVDISPAWLTVSLPQIGEIQAKTIEVWPQNAKTSLLLALPPAEPVSVHYSVESRELESELFGPIASKYMTLVTLSVINNTAHTVEIRSSTIAFKARCRAASGKELVPCDLVPLAAADVMGIAGGEDFAYDEAGRLAKGFGGVFSALAGTVIPGVKFLAFLNAFGGVGVNAYTEWGSDEKTRWRQDLIADLGKDQVDLKPGEAQNMRLFLPQCLEMRQNGPMKLCTEDLGTIVVSYAGVGPGGNAVGPAAPVGAGITPAPSGNRPHF